MDSDLRAAKRLSSARVHTIFIGLPMALGASAAGTVWIPLRRRPIRSVRELELVADAHGPPPRRLVRLHRVAKCGEVIGGGLPGGVHQVGDAGPELPVPQ